MSTAQKVCALFTILQFIEVGIMLAKDKIGVAWLGIVFGCIGVYGVLA